MYRDLIFDFGLHNGDDTDFYLKKGFRVVAVDANASLCRAAAVRFKDAVRAGTLTILNVAIADQPGTTAFFANPTNSAWGTTDPDWVRRNARLGATSSVPVEVEAVTVPQVISEHGVPYYAKIDIEGVDLTALRGFIDCQEKPAYVSIESDKVSFRALRQEFDVFLQLGYSQFKVVPQRWINRQVLPIPALEGSSVHHNFPLGSSGAFGEEAPGEWVDANEALRVYRKAFLQYALTGDDPYVESKILRRLLRYLGFRMNWYDTHAKLDEL